MQMDGAVPGSSTVGQGLRQYRQDLVGGPWSGHALPDALAIVVADIDRNVIREDPHAPGAHSLPQLDP
jgi:hypothetical protein